jgi:hypothetical protein
VIVTVGLIIIAGSGGGGVSLFPEWDGIGGIPPTPPPTPLQVSVAPSRLVVQAGETARFTASTRLGSTYQWRRNGVDIAGATSSTYTLTGANVGDDDAQFTVVVHNSGETATATGVLRVSPLPAVVFEDTEFAMTDWSATVLAAPPPSGPTVTVSQQLGYRRIVYEMPSWPTSVRIPVVHAWLRSAYDPAVQGAILVVDGRQECIALEDMGLSSLHARLMLEQGGRVFMASKYQWCYRQWGPSSIVAQRADEFIALDGTLGSPDFSANGAPIRFGLITEAQIAPSAGKPISQGVDNWKVTVWRK